MAPAFAQFNSGSTGVDGALNVTANTTLDLPASGIFNFTTINIAANTTLRFNRNPLNTPVHLLATGDVTIAGTIDVSGERGSNLAGGLGGPGGFKGGDPGIFNSTTLPGDGQGPGGGRGSAGVAVGNGNFGATSGGANDGSPYGTLLLIPMIGGSGGGGNTRSPSGFGGGGGGGGILIASSTRITLSGRVLAQGASTPNGTSGSGGGIRLVAPAVTGNGELNVARQSGGSAGRGRIRIDALDRNGVNLSFQPSEAVSLGVAMIALASPLPRLDIIQAAGASIAEGTPNPVTIALPSGADPNQTVVVQARDFNAIVPIQVILTPEHGQASKVDAMIDNRSANPAQTTVNVSFLSGAPTAVHVFTR